LANGFEGVYDLADLTPNEAPWLRVTNRRTGASFPHDFPPGEITHEFIASHYPGFRERVERRAAAFQQHLRARGPYLYILLWRPSEEGEPEPEPERLASLLSLLRRHPAHECSLLCVVAGDETEDWTDASRGLYRRSIAGRLTKSAERAWEGEDQEWDEVLAEFPLWLHNVVRRSAGVQSA
jgi:hypothetical protein